MYQLRLLERPLDIVVGLPGRHTRAWDLAMRPAPPNSRFVQLAEVMASPRAYDCIIAHNLTDLLDVRTLVGPKLFVIHLTLDGMILEQNAQTDAGEFRRAVKQFTEASAAHVTAVSRLKAESWGFAGEKTAPLSADPLNYLPWRGDIAKGLRISNFILRRRRTLHWDFHQQAFAGVPVTLVGHNPEFPGVAASRNWEDLKETLCRHRFFIHTADPQLEDGYNVATLEAMAAGLPVLGNFHPTSPVIQGVNGFLFDDPAKLKLAALRLLGDRELAREMGSAAQQTAAQRFSGEAFCSGMRDAIEQAQKKFSAKQRADSVTLAN
ncbi:MAG TPA: glycosyltransferase [Candidatus Acidoferrum sp.]